MIKRFIDQISKHWIWALTCLVLGSGLFGLGYWQGKQSLQPQLRALAAQVNQPPHPPGSPLARGNGAYPMLPPGANGAHVPANASPEMKEFLGNRATLMQKMAELRQANPGPGTNGAPDPKLLAQFREQNKALLDRQQQLAQIIGQQQAANPPAMPPPLQIPPNASPEMKTYLTARDQLMRDQIAFMNQHRTDDPQTRQAAMQQWRQQNAARFQQLRQQAQAMAQSSTPTSPTTPVSTSTN